MADSGQEKYRSFHKGQIILKEGQTNPEAFMIRRGAVSLYKVVNNRRVVLASMKPGEIFGEMALVTGEPFNATAEAEEYVELIPFDRQLMQSLLIKCPNPIQRMLRHLIDRIRAMDAVVSDQPTSDIFISVCQILELAAPSSSSEGDVALKNAIGYGDFCRAVKNIIFITQEEIDDIVEKLQKVNLVNIRSVKGATFKKDVFGRMTKSSEYLRDRIIAITDRRNFMTAVRNLRRDMHPADESAYTAGLEFIDIHELADMADTRSEVIIDRIGKKDLSERMIFFNSSLAREWADNLDEDYFSPEERRRKSVKDLSTVDDVIHVRDADLQQAFSMLGMDKVVALYAVAGKSTKKKILANLSKKMSRIVAEEAKGKEIDVVALAKIEEELFHCVQKIKGA